MEKEFAQKILNRVRFHAPILYDSKIDRRVLFDAGIDPNKPIFLFDKPMNKPLFRAFVTASREEEFNLVVPFSCVQKLQRRRLEKIKNLILFSPDDCPISLFEMINKLNINYSASTNYDIKFSKKFFKVNGEILNAQYDDFSLMKSMNFGDLAVDYREFVLNGSNFFLKIHNFAKAPAKLSIELNIPLEKGYYFFKREGKTVKIVNLQTGEVSHLNCNARGAKFRFSQVDGLENSTYSCINVQAKITVKKSDFLFFNFGKEVFSMKDENAADSFFSLAKSKCYEIFDVRTGSKNPKFDRFFNFTLPQKIWLSWLDGKKNAQLEEKYIALKKLFIKSGDRLDFQRFREIGLREIGVFNGEYYKKILVISGSERFLRVGRTYFYNTNSIAKTALATHEPICVCFGENVK